MIFKITATIPDGDEILLRADIKSFAEAKQFIAQLVEKDKMISAFNDLDVENATWITPLRLIYYPKKLDFSEYGWGYRITPICENNNDLDFWNQLTI